MDHFTYRHAEPACESVSLSAVADVLGTPVDVDSKAALLEQDGDAQFLEGGQPRGRVLSLARRRLVAETYEDLVTGEEMS